LEIHDKIQTQKYFIFVCSLKNIKWEEVCDKVKDQFANNANIEFRNANPNGDIVVASNLNNIDFFFFLNCENQVKKQTSYVIFSTRYCEC
jgi:hypothetical protein